MIPGWPLLFEYSLCGQNKSLTFRVSIWGFDAIECLRTHCRHAFAIKTLQCFVDLRTDSKKLHSDILDVGPKIFQSIYGLYLLPICSPPMLPIFSLCIKNARTKDNLFFTSQIFTHTSEHYAFAQCRFFSILTICSWILTLCHGPHDNLTTVHELYNRLTNERNKRHKTSLHNYIIFRE